MRGLGAAALLAVCAVGCAAPPAATTRAEPWLSEWDLLLRQSAVLAARQEAPALERIVTSKAHGVLHHLALRPGSRLDAPPAAAEVLIVVEGRGTLVVAGAERPVEAGDVLVLPAGARGAAQADAGQPLLALAARARSAVETPGAQAQFLAVEDLFPGAALHGPERLWRRRVARIPGQVAVDAVAVKRGEVPRHVHLDHDEVVFVLQGFGTLGHGEEDLPKTLEEEELSIHFRPELGRTYVNSAIVARGLVYLPARTPHGYVDEANPTLALSISLPDVGDARDTYAIPDHARAQSGETVKRAPRRSGVELTRPPVPAGD